MGGADNSGSRIPGIGLTGDTGFQPLETFAHQRCDGLPRQDRAGHFSLFDRVVDMQKSLPGKIPSTFPITL